MSALATTTLLACNNTEPMTGVSGHAGISTYRKSRHIPLESPQVTKLRSGMGRNRVERLKAGSSAQTRQRLQCTRRRLGILMSELQTEIPRPNKTGLKPPVFSSLAVTLRDGPLAGELTVQGSLDVEQLDEAKVFNLLTDHEHSHEIFRTILDVDRKDQPDGSIRLAQNCRWKFLFFSGSFPVELEVREDRDARSFTFKDMKQSGLMKKMEGSWTVGPSKAIPGGVCVEHTLTVKMALAAPPPFEKYTKKIFASQVTEIMTDLQIALEAKSSAASPIIAKLPNEAVRHETVDKTSIDKYESS